MGVSLLVFLPIPMTGKGVAYSCQSLSEGMASEDLEVTVVTPRATRRFATSMKVNEVLPRWTRPLPYRFVRRSARSRIDRKFLSCMTEIASPASAYIWPDAEVETLRRLKAAGVIVFREMI